MPPPAPKPGAEAARSGGTPARTHVPAPGIPPVMGVNRAGGGSRPAPVATSPVATSPEAPPAVGVRSSRVAVPEALARSAHAPAPGTLAPVLHPDQVEILRRTGHRPGFRHALRCGFRPADRGESARRGGCRACGSRDDEQTQAKSREEERGRCGAEMG
jgi:hypothetical protein